MPVMPTATFKLKFQGSGDLTYNPNNSRKTFKIIFPKKYTDKINKVELWTKEGEFFQKLYRPLPVSTYQNEWGNRSRWYGSKKPLIPPNKYPKNIRVFVFVKDGSIGTITIKDPTKRYD